MSEEDVCNEINKALDDMYSKDEAQKFLFSQQSLLGGEIPAVLMIKGEASMVLAILNGNKENSHE